MSWSYKMSRGVSMANPMPNFFSEKLSIIDKFFANVPVATASISNPSLATNSSKESVKENAVLSPSILLDEETQTEIYEKYLRDNNMQPTDLSPMIFRTILPLMETLSNEGDIFIFALKFYLSYLQHSKIPELFSGSVEKNPIYIHKLSKYTLEERCILHSMYVNRIDKMIMSAFEESKEEKANEILGLVALSHVIMNIGENDMKKMNYLLIKFLLHYNFINEEQLAPYIYFIESRTFRLNNALEYHRNRKTVNSNNQSSVCLSDSLARENYRFLKKWNAIVMNVTKALEKPLIDLDNYIEKMKQEETKSEGPVVEKCLLINLLKKGYKYRHELTDDKKLKSKRLPNPRPIAPII